MPLYSYTTAGSNVIRSLMLLSITSVFSTLMGASVAAGASVAGASVACAGGSVAAGPSGAVAGAAGAQAVRITSASEIRIIRGLRFDWYISSSSGKVVGE